MIQIITGLAAIKRTNEITSKQSLEWARGVKAKRAQKALIEATKGNRFQYHKKQEPKNRTLDNTKAGRREKCINCKYCRSTHETWRCPAYGRSSSTYGKLNHFEQVYKSQSSQVPKDDKRCRTIHDMHPDSKDKEVEAQKFDKVRPKVLLYQSIRSIINCKVESK